MARDPSSITSSPSLSVADKIEGACIDHRLIIRLTRDAPVKSMVLLAQQLQRGVK